MNKNTQEWWDKKICHGGDRLVGCAMLLGANERWLSLIGVDAPLGHVLANKPIWAPRETLAALSLIVKYKKQQPKLRAGLFFHEKRIEVRPHAAAKPPQRNVVASFPS